MTESSIRQDIIAHAVPLKSSGENVLVKEAEEHQYVLLGELHGETEIPQLLSDLWPRLWKANYRHIAAEVSPWAATHLERPATEDTTPVPGLWTRQQAADMHRVETSQEPVLWGCDIEEMQPGQLIRQMALLNPADAGLRNMQGIIAHGYTRKLAPELLRIAKSDHPEQDALIGGASLWESTLNTLEVESLRSDPHTRYEASNERERVMKELFLRHREHDPQGKILLRFGRNHLHRGLDARGISTLGNFVGEWALAQGQSVVNVGVFAAGGKEHLAGQTFEADERQDELAFALLASLSGSEATLYDLKQLRPTLHAIAEDKRTPLEKNLIYWADSYDYLLCYPSVSPLLDSSADPR
ncbi:hypothetical protein [Paracidobacterium acidisoli]|uniref:hypothetical protein n=1 Tax=Paracidobacterium acidisoli TaxID=2303751 RepID=UPI0011C1AA3D|nr:hypothetical protein [Paracidobacterium acidisoli]MBT9329542.1 hypothetical protein [Paracidobacterium acidisoli]